MTNFLVFQHVAVEHAGCFRDFWRADGIDWTEVELDVGEPIPADLDRYDALFVMGGPMDVWQTQAHPWLTAEKQAIRHFVTTLRRPFFGICLGHQLLADALGGAVGLAARPEVGLASVALTAAGRDDRLFAGFAPSFTTLQWHGAEITRLPEGATVLAQNAACDVQAFRWGDHAYGVQFHPELTEDSIADFDGIPAYRDYLEATLGPGEAVKLAAGASRLLPMFTAAARRLHDNFMQCLAGDLTVANRRA